LSGSGDRLDRANYITLPEVTGCAGHVYFPRGPQQRLAGPRSALPPW
jgi:hypothetical protein